MPHPALRALLRRFGLSLAAVALVAACTPPAATPGIALDLDDPTPTAIRGTSLQITVDLTRLGGADAPVALSVTGLPANVAAAFAPASLTGSATESTLTLSVGASATEGTSDLTVTGTTGTLSDDVDLTLTIGGLTVTGRVRQGAQRPLIGATVASQDETATTDATGAFTLSGLSVPYDLVVSSEMGDGSLHLFEGLTSPTPVVRPALDRFRAPMIGFSTTIDGSIDGGALGLDEVVVVCVEGLSVAVKGCDTLGVGASAYSIGAGWFDESVATARLHAFHLEVDGDGLPTAYLGYETLLLDLTDGVAALADLDFDPVATDTLTGTTSHPVALPDSDLIVMARFGPNLSMRLVAVEDPADAFALLVPVLPGLSYDVVFVGSDAVSGDDVLTWKHDVGLDAGAFAVAASAQMVAPAAAATGVDLTTEFTSTAVGGARTYLWGPDGVPGVVYARTTTRTTVTIPDPTLGGFTVPAGAAYDWTILGHGDEDVDSAAAGGYADYDTLLLMLLIGGGPGLDGDRTFAMLGADRGFRFAP